MTSRFLSAEELLRLQQEQFAHDRRNHSDILCLPRSDRLKHYGLHFAKYVGRLVRQNEKQPLSRTVVDATLVCLSSANALAQNLSVALVFSEAEHYSTDRLSDLADAAGRYADGCEKIDHLEEFLPLVKLANLDVFRWAVVVSGETSLDLMSAIKARRKELAERAFFVSTDEG